MEGLQALHFPFSKGKFEVLIDGTDKLKQGLLRQLEVLGGRRVRFGAQRGERADGDVHSWSGGVAQSEPGSSRKTGAQHSQSDPHLLECWVLLGSEVLGPLVGLAADRTRPQPCWLTLRRQERRTAGLGDESRGRHSRPRYNAGSAARLRGQGQPAQAAVVRRHRRGSHLRAHVTSAGLERAVCEAPHPRWHEDQPLGSGAKNGGLLGRSGFVDVVRQLWGRFSGKP